MFYYNSNTFVPFFTSYAPLNALQRTCKTYNFTSTRLMSPHFLGRTKNNTKSADIFLQCFRRTGCCSFLFLSSLLENSFINLVAENLLHCYRSSSKHNLLKLTFNFNMQFYGVNFRVRRHRAFM